MDPFGFTAFYIRHAFLTWMMNEAEELSHINYTSAPIHLAPPPRHLE